MGQEDQSFKGKDSSKPLESKTVHWFKKRVPKKKTEPSDLPSLVGPRGEVFPQVPPQRHTEATVPVFRVSQATYGAPA